MFRTLLHPLVGTVHAAAIAFTVLGGGDFAAVVAFLLAALVSVLTCAGGRVVVIRFAARRL